MCNKPPCYHFLVIIMYVEDVHKHHSQFHVISEDLDL